MIIIKNTKTGSRSTIKFRLKLKASKQQLL